MVSGAFTLGDKSVGGDRCLIIAEAGVNHNGDVALAHKLVDVAAGAGADAVKFQTFDPAQLVSRSAPKAQYQIAATGTADTQYEMLRALMLPEPAFAELARHAAERGILFLSTAFDLGSADLLERIGVPAFKIPSGELTNHDFIAALARRGKPLLVSTGMSTLAEVEQAVAVVRRSGNPSLALFHCVTEYPAAPADCNLRAMDTLRLAIGVPTGWSDHTTGTTVSVAAVAAGAELIEKHFTLDRSLPGPDHEASLEPDELTRLVSEIRTVEAARGDGVKRPARSELANMAIARRSLHARLDLPAGHVIATDDLVALRPGNGIPPFERNRLVGRRLKVAVPGGVPLREEHLA